VAVLLFIGDICGRPGRRAVRELLPEIKKRHNPVLVAANGENGAGGIGLTPEVADELLFSGVDIITSGNHIWKKRSIQPYLDSSSQLLRPANYPRGAPGRGVQVVRKEHLSIAVINVQGRVFMPPLDCPFQTCRRILDELSPEIKIKMVDFHAEATSEKQAMGWFLDGKVSLVLGTHTHVQTADERILPMGTGYITDVGMSGSQSSVIGMKREVAIKRIMMGMPEQFVVAKKNIELQGVLADVDDYTGKCNKIERLKIPV